MSNTKKSKTYAIVMIGSICWLIFIISFSLGIYVYIAQKWPYAVIQKIETFIAGDSGEKTSLVEKIKNDLNIKPSRHIVSSQKSFLIPETYKELCGLPLNPRRNKPKIFLSENAPVGFRLIYGIFDFKKSLHGAILLDPKGNIKNVWHLSQEDVAWNHRPDTNVFPHGIEILPDGSLVNAYDSGTCLTKYDYCGKIVWRIKGGFHHSITFDGDAALWTWGNAGSDHPYGDNFIKVDCKTGDILKEFHLDKVMAANQDIDIFGILQEDYAKGSKWITDAAGGRWHVNDIDPLLETLAPYYPGFKIGDLLFSLRAPNLICIIDPDTYKVKWWRQGLTRRQHDPDWNKAGTITIFNNNMHRGYSSIVELNPYTYEYQTVVKGEKYEFYTSIQGKHQRLPNGGYLITSPQQGRVFEVDGKGNITFEFINSFGENRAFLAVSEARFLPLDYFKELPVCEFCQ